MKEMESLVNECLLQHKGGEKFFDAIDEKLRNDSSLITMMIGKILTNEKFDYIIVSGKFGSFFKEYCQKHMNHEFYENIIVTNGSLRKDNITVNLEKEFNFKDKKVIFIDDSYYLGRTKNKIKETIEKNKGQLINTYVFYDGCKTKEKDVQSFYRYYDYYE